MLYAHTHEEMRFVSQKFPVQNTQKKNILLIPWINLVI